MKTIKFEDVDKYIGVAAEPTEWFKITQDQITQFADTTLDQYYIHTDPEKAKHGPFGATIAHGMLTLSMLPHFSYDYGYVIEGTSAILNYGFNRVRFIHPVKVDSRVRAIATLLSVTEKASGQYLLEIDVEIEIENESKPALRASTLVMQM